MSYQNPATFSPYTPPPDEQKSNRNSVRYAPIPSSSTTASTSASASANPFAGVYRQTEQLPDGQIKINKYETGLPIRVDIEAALAYALGCVTGVMLLIMEQKNDYVRFHAWQSSLLFATIFFFHFIILFINSVLSWIFAILEIGLIIFLCYRAYVDGITLERFEMPIFGTLASTWVDSE
ncbi:3768_t:CDS:2 [Funneliformis caledonium]|uniref:3768_t:CDS:1 n=1 Tax=Funneliformis caledonium TaxID=1117310 RepID=A0A9N9A8C3_9GLOM|nr:3768_t:CDS:2 [Funneliformis caledonium]